MSEDAAWHELACAEADVDHDKSTMANTDASQAGAHAARAVLIRSDRMWDNGAVRVDPRHPHQSDSITQLI